MSKIRVLIVDDEPMVRSALRRVLEGELGEDGFEPYLFHTADEALVYLRDRQNPRPDIIFTDTSMPGMRGPEFLRAVRAEQLAPDAYCVIMSGGDQNVAQSALADGHAHYFMAKPMARVDFALVMMQAAAHLARQRV